MATPVAAGIIALWLQAAKDKNKTLTNADIKDIIAHSSDTDKFTEKTPARFGSGKINAYKGLLYVLDIATSIKGLSQHQPENVTFRLDGSRLYAEGADDGTPSASTTSRVYVSSRPPSKVAPSPSTASPRASMPSSSANSALHSYVCNISKFPPQLDIKV